MKPQLGVVGLAAASKCCACTPMQMSMQVGKTSEQQSIQHNTSVQIWGYKQKKHRNKMAGYPGPA
jgi:hypothetical protein